MKNTYTIDTRIYAGEKIQEAIEDFSEVAEISFSDDTLSIAAESKENSDEIFNEFMNYVLSL